MQRALQHASNALVCVDKAVPRLAENSFLQSNHGLKGNNSRVLPSAEPQQVVNTKSHFRPLGHALHIEPNLQKTPV
jgi:hypothetical protein